MAEIIGTEAGPPPPGAGVTPGRWVKLGHVSVDGAHIMVCDPGYAKRFDYEAFKATQRDVTDDFAVHDWSEGVGFLSGFGDGGYDVWGWIVEYADAGGYADERVAQIVVTLIDDNRAQEWASQ